MKAVGTVLLIVGLLGLIGADVSLGTSYYFPKLGRPIVTEDRLVFSGPGWKSHRLICISKTGEKRLWEIEDNSAVIAPCFVMGQDLLITKDADVYTCDLSSGKTRLVFRTEYKRCGLHKARANHVIIAGEKDGVDYLSLVDLGRAKRIWEVPKINTVLAKGSGVILCQVAERRMGAHGGYTLVNQHLVALSATSGSAIWRFPLPKVCDLAHTVLMAEYFVAEAAGTIYCFRQDNGEVVSALKVQKGVYPCVSLAARSGDILVWTCKGDREVSGYVVFSLTVPNLERRNLLEPDWYSAVSYAYADTVMGTTIGRIDTYHIPSGKKIWEGGQWNWDGVHDGFIYFSTMEPNGTHTSVNRIEVKTGNRTKLYEEELPPKLQWPRDDRPKLHKPTGRQSDYR